ncbi:MAG: glycosyltransferase family 2 protein [Gemmataceae bacterium]|nr:glycosyltransferase family 2 protein [Gemmataceae bacterium]MCS7269632.1 glycosyltransferase family 2 protein [Gemmataceae bacterium]MDW8243712.1 glycosyltransferase family 2 protein [Thermogemmata sp.]
MEQQQLMTLLDNAEAAVGQTSWLVTKAEGDDRIDAISRRTALARPVASGLQKNAVGHVMVSVCIVNWNSRELLRRCLRSLLHQPQGVCLEVIVVDNGSWDGAAEMVAGEFPQVRLVCNRSNRGYATACNQGAAVARGRYLFFLNNDTEVPAGALGELVAAAEAHPEGGIFAPRLVGSDGMVQGSCRGPLTLAALCHRLGWLRWTGWFREAYEQYRRGGQGVAQADGLQPVQAVLGCALLVRRDILTAVGGWDEGYRFGVEDIDLCQRVRRQAGVYYVSHVTVLHHGRVASRANIGYVMGGVAAGYIRYLRKAGVSRWALLAYKLAVTADAPVQGVLKLLEGAYRWLVGRRQDAGRSWLAARGHWTFLWRELAHLWWT